MEIMAHWASVDCLITAPPPQIPIGTGKPSQADDGRDRLASSTPTTTTCPSWIAHWVDGAMRSGCSGALLDDLRNRTIDMEPALNISLGARAGVQVPSQHPQEPRGQQSLPREESSGSRRTGHMSAEGETAPRPAAHHFQGPPGPGVSSASPPEAVFYSSTNSSSSLVAISAHEGGPHAESSAAAAHRRTQHITTPLWSQISGSQYCEISQDGACVTDGSGRYGNYEQCTVRAEVAMLVSAQAGFSTESGYDYVTLGGTRYSGTSGPTSLAMSAGETLHWQSDGSVGLDGFNICGAQLIPPAPPLPPFPPQPPPMPPEQPQPPAPPRPRTPCSCYGEGWVCFYPIKHKPREKREEQSPLYPEP
jgi:hypothetical protein